MNRGRTRWRKTIMIRWTGSHSTPMHQVEFGGSRAGTIGPRYGARPAARIICWRPRTDHVSDAFSGRNLCCERVQLKKLPSFHSWRAYRQHWHVFCARTRSGRVSRTRWLSNDEVVVSCTSHFSHLISHFSISCNYPLSTISYQLFRALGRISDAFLLFTIHYSLFCSSPERATEISPGCNPGKGSQKRIPEPA